LPSPYRISTLLPQSGDGHLNQARRPPKLHVDQVSGKTRGLLVQQAPSRIRYVSFNSSSVHSVEAQATTAPDENHCQFAYVDSIRAPVRCSDLTSIRRTPHSDAFFRRLPLPIPPISILRFF
jgi:hypothetical protein